LESRFTLGSEAHGIAENRQEGTEDLALKKDPIRFHFSHKIKTQNKEEEKEKKKERRKSGWNIVLCGTQEERYPHQ